MDMTVLNELAPIVRTMAHPLRLRILDYLEREKEPRCVSQIVAVSGAEQAVVSQQLRILKDQGILECQREGTFVYYRILDQSIFQILECIRRFDFG